jgi:hypothetical protein
MYLSDGTTEMAFARKMKDQSMHAAQMWKMMDATPFHDESVLASKVLA